MRKSLVMVLVITMALVFVGCGETTKPAPSDTPSATELASPSAVVSTEPTPEAKTFKLTYNILENNEHPQGITMNTFAEKIEELSGGQITVDTYPSGTLFSQEGEVVAVMTGELSMSNLSFQDIGPYLPSANMFAAPYIWTSYDHMNKFFASDLSKEWFQEVADATGFLPLAPMCQGSRIINTKREKPVITPEDMKGMILRMPNAPAWIAAGESLGASVTPVAYAEVYTALQTGAVEAQDNPFAGTIAMKFYEVTKQISLTNHIIDVKLICVNYDLWNQMSEQQQQWMVEAAKYAGSAGSQATYDSEAENLQFLKDEGMIITEPDIDAFQAYSHQYYVDNGHATDWDMDLYDAIQAMK